MVFKLVLKQYLLVKIHLQALEFLKLKNISKQTDFFDLWRWFIKHRFEKTIEISPKA